MNYKGWDILENDKGKFYLKFRQFKSEPLFNSIEEAQQVIDAKKDKAANLIKMIKSGGRKVITEIITTGNLGDTGPHSKGQISSLSKLRRRPVIKGFKSIKVVRKKKKETPTINLASYLKSLKIVKK